LIQLERAEVSVQADEDAKEGEEVVEERETLI